MGDRLIFQLGTNNWQRGGEFAPGSGILHEAHHHAYNALPGLRCYSMYPSRRQRFQHNDVRIFALDHDIPICESVSPVSNYRWHRMSEAEVAAYRLRLTDEVANWIGEIEAETEDRFELAIAHHAFMNTVVMRDVIRRRAMAGRGTMPLLCFAHGTELKMYANERRGDRPDEFPLRFLPFMQREKMFDYADPAHGVDVVASTSAEQIAALLAVFPEFPRDRVVLSPNGYNRHVFRRLTEPTDVFADRAKVLAGFMTQPPEGTGKQPEPVAPPAGFDAVVAFCGKFADWKRLDALLHAAAIYERHDRRILTLVIGSGPLEAQVELYDIAAGLGLRRTYFLGPRLQDELAVLFNCADVGCFPSYREPFGLVFLECMACGTPVIGADSGGPRDFVTPKVGTLVPETDDRQTLAASLAAAVIRAVDEDWKGSKGPTAEAYAMQNFGVVSQVSKLVEAVDRLPRTIPVALAADVPLGRRSPAHVSDNGRMRPVDRIPYERYFEVMAVPEPGVPIHSFAFLRRLTSGVLETSLVWDAHAHIGRDRDGRHLDVEALIHDLDEYHVDCAVIFPFNDPDQGVDFRVPNDRIWAAFERAPARLIPFMRLNPNGPWEAEYQRCRDRGCRGIKLHPRAQDFALDSPAVRELFATAAADGLPVLVHTGFGMGPISDEVAALAKALPKLQLILGHSTFIDMPRAVAVLASYPNIYFETSVMPAYDLFTVLDTIDPARVLYGSDLPYASSYNSLQELAVMANVVGVDKAHYADLFGGNLQRLLGGTAKER